MVFSKPINDVSTERSAPQFWLLYFPGIFIENVCSVLFPAENRIPTNLTFTFKTIRASLLPKFLQTAV